MIKLNDDEIQILGTPNFASAFNAKLLIKAGVYEDKAEKAEYEQAVFIHWALNLYEQHGNGWKTEGNKILNQCHKKIQSMEPTYKGEW